jgi:hypothetical protein
MRKCIKTRFIPSKLKKSFFKDMILAVWKYAQMLCFWYGSMRKCYFFGMEVCAKALKHVFNHSKMKKKVFFKDMILVVWKYAQMHQNKFLTTIN